MGLCFGTLLVIEKLFLGKLLEKTKIIKYIYTTIIVIISFLIFSVESVPEILTNLKNMFFITDIPLTSLETNYYLRSYLVLLITSIIGATPLLKIIIGKLKETKLKVVIDILEPIYLIGLLLLSTAFLIDASFNPFLYFRF